MLRVLVLTTLFPDETRPTFGSFVERQTLALAQQDDIEVEVVAPIGIAPWPLSLHPRYRQFANVPEREVWKELIVHRPRFTNLPVKGSRFRPALLARALEPVCAEIRQRFDFDVIDAEFFYPDGPAAMRLAEAFEVPFSATARGSDIHFWGQRNATRKAIVETGRKADGLVAVSKALRRDMADMGMGEEKIAVHYAGVDRDIFKPVDRAAAKRELEVDGPLIVSVGALIPLKGQHLLVEAMQDISGAELWLVGEGPERPRLEKQIETLGLGDRVTLLGSQPHGQVARLLQAADVMALPSEREGMANAWLEALASGTPVVITDVGGAGEIVNEPEAGLLVEREPTAIAAGINALLANPVERGKVAALVEDFSWDTHAQLLARHLRQLAKKSGRGGEAQAPATPTPNSLAAAALEKSHATTGIDAGKPLRVLTLATLFPDSARPRFGVFVERQTLELAARDDVELEVVAPIGIPPWPFNRHPKYRQFDDVPECENWKGVTVHRPRFTTIPRVGRRLFPTLLARRARPLLDDIRTRFAFDVIDAEFFYPDGPAAMRLAEQFNIPFSVKARGSDIHYWGEKPGCGSQVLAAGRAAQGALAVSKAMKDDMVALGIDGEKITVHYTGIDREQFHPIDRATAKAGLGIDGPLIVTVGALIDRKGQRLVVDALAAIPDAVLILVGEGEDREYLERQVSRLGFDDRVRLPGNLAHDEVARHLAAADVMALPSRSEGLANAWVEALACGTPIVISDAGGAGELMDRPEAGAIVERDAGAIANAINAILADPPDQAAVCATVDRFSWERNSEMLFDHLSNIAKRQ